MAACLVVCAERLGVARQLESELRFSVDYEQTHRDLVAYNQEEFRQWQCQAMRGLHADRNYALKNNPSTYYWKIMDNCFTGYNQDDEEIVKQWQAS